MSIEIEEINTLEGPNIYYPQPAVMGIVQADHDIRNSLITTIKTWAQAVGVVIGYLRARPMAAEGAGLRLQVSYTCNVPVIGAAIFQHAIADLQAAERRDEDWSHDDALFDLRRQRMREDPGLPLLQLRAEAQGRGLPVLPAGDGYLQVGTGHRSWRFDPSGLSVGLSISPPWSEIGLVPVILVGGSGSEPLATLLADQLEAQWGPLARAVPGTFEAIRAALLSQEARAVVASVDTHSALTRGLPLNRCTAAVVLPFTELNEPEGLAAGLPALLAEQLTILVGDEQRVLSLRERTAAPVLHLQPGGAVETPDDALLRSVAQIVQTAI